MPAGNETNKSNHYAFERIAQMFIESAVDIGNMIIDGFILRDPGNYKDVIDILALEKVISKDTQHQINQTVDVRKQFVHYYDELNTTTLIPIFDEAVPFYQSYIDEVIQFLKNERKSLGRRKIIPERITEMQKNEKKNV